MTGMRLSIFTDRIRGVWRWFTGGRVSRPALWLWLFMLVAAVFLFEWLEDMKSPWKTNWAEEVAQGRRHTFKTFLWVGLWWGTLAHASILTLLLLTVRWWGRAGGARFQVSLSAVRGRWSPWFVTLLLLLCAAAALVRWPKMSQSYWGDEGWAVAPYVYGKHVPAAGGDFQGVLEYKPVSWAHTAFDDHTCGNHYLFSLSQRAGLSAWRWWHGLPEEAFDEAISRLPPFVAGIGSLPLLALMLAWLGRPGAGLASALMLALHPWHVRYSTEARGYTMMLFFLILAVWFALLALKDGRWRWWLAFGAAEFLCMYSWKGVMYPLAAANLVLLLWVLTGKLLACESAGSGAGRRVVLARWLVSNLLAAGLFINLTYPCVLQIKEAKTHLVQLSGRPMDRVWLHNSISSVFTGMRWHVEEKENPTNVVLSTELHKHPLRSGLELTVLAGLLVTGSLAMARRSGWQTALWLSMIAAGAAGAACFRWLIGAEWITWYFFFETLPLAVLAGFGLDTIRLWLWRDAWFLDRESRGWRWALGALVLLPPVAFADLTWPEVGLMRHQAYENHRAAFLATRGRHEPLHSKEPSKVHTLYVWRYISLYDPRGDTHVRDAKALRERIARVEAENGELYVVVGHRKMARRYNGDLMALIEDPRLFEPVATYWAPEELHCLHCFHYRKDGAGEAVIVR